jgi:hypothetical protein
VTHDKEHVQDEAIRKQANQLLERGRAILRIVPRLPEPVQRFARKLIARVEASSAAQPLLSWLKWLILPIVVWAVMILSMVR